MLKTIELKPVLLKPKEEFLKPDNINFQTKIGTTVYVVNVLRNILFEAIICRIRQIKSGRSRTILCSA